MMKLTFITCLATWFNCVPDDVRMINKILFSESFSAMIWSVLLSFFFEEGNNLTGTTELN